MAVLKLKCIQTGSVGNCYIIRTPNNFIMLDCGSPLIQNYLTKYNFNKLDFVFITHKHKDHCGFINTINYLPKTKLICNDDTYEEILKLTKNNLKLKRLKEGSFFKTIEVPHDVPNWGYIIEIDGFKICYITDAGHIPQSWDIEIFKSVDLMLFEANYVSSFIERNIDINLKLKCRITSGFGHLSFAQSREFINKVKTSTMRVCFVHRSLKNSSIEEANKFIQKNEIWMEEGKELHYEK